METLIPAGPSPVTDHMLCASKNKYISVCGGQLREKLRTLQATFKGQYLRTSWCSYHSGHAYEQYREDWGQALIIMAAPSALSLVSRKWARVPAPHTSPAQSPRVRP